MRKVKKKSLSDATLMAITAWAMFAGFCLNAFAAEDPNKVFSNRRYKSYFDRTVVFGNSISSNVWAGKGRIGDSYGKGPGTVLAEDYAGVKELANFAEPRAEQLGLTIDLYPAFHKMRRLAFPDRYGIDDEYESRDPKRHYSEILKAYQDASAIVAIDAFYMEAIWNCPAKPNEPMTDEQIARVHASFNYELETFLDMAERDRKVVILGNLPNERFESMSWVNRLALFAESPTQDWDERCRQAYNKVIHNQCANRNGCYEVNMEKIMNEAYNNKLTLQDGRVIEWNKKQQILGITNQIRPDGLHLSRETVRYVVDDILSQIAANPPQMTDSSQQKP